MPPANFTGLVSLLVTQTLFALGAIGAKMKKKNASPNSNLPATISILLGMLEEKTKGNLSPEGGRTSQKCPAPDAHDFC